MDRNKFISLCYEIEQERYRQDKQWGGSNHDDKHGENDWLVILMRHLGLAANDEAEEVPERFRRQLVRVAAIALAALESYDRTHEKPAGVYQAGSGF